MKLGFNFINGQQYIKLSQSFIKNFFKNGEPIEYCPYQVKRTTIDRQFRVATEPMIKGNYFETKAIGGTVGGWKVLDLPRLRNGSRSADHKRIDAQVRTFHKDVEKYKIDINKLTVQKKFEKVIPNFVENLTIILDGTLDILSYIDYGGRYHKAAIDLKLTKDVNTTGGDFCWGSPNDMDHIQAYLYHFLTGLPFYYMIYDYKASVLEKKAPLPIYIGQTHIKEMMETIRKTCAEIIYNEMEGWKPNPNINKNIGFKRSIPICSKCKVKDCKYYNNQNFIINKS